MANRDAPRGLQPIRHSAGGEMRPSKYTIADQYDTNIFTGDPVKSTGTGRNIAIGTAGGNILGVFAGCSYKTAAGDFAYSNYWPASTDVIGEVTAWVWDDPNIIFRAQAAGSIVAADIGLLADLSSGNGSVVTGRSGWEVGGHDGAEAQVKVLGLYDEDGNAFGDNADVEIMIMEHELRGGGVEV